MCGARRSRVPNEVSSSTRPSGAPRQKWIPAPNVMCGFGSRPRSSSSGRSNAAGGRVVGPEPLELIGVAVQGPPAVAGHVHRGLVAGVQQEDAGADHLVLGEAITLVDHLDQATDQVLGRVLAALTDQLAEVVGELHGRRRSRSAVLLGGIQLVHPADLGRPRTEVVAIGLGDAQQLGDHRHRERLGHRGDQIDLAGAEDLLNQPVHQPLDGRPELLDPTGGERLGHQPADAGVVWRLHVEDPLPDRVPDPRREQRIPGATHLPVRGQMEIGASEPPVAQQPVDVLVVRDDPLLGLGVVDDPAGSAQLGVRGIRVGDEHEIARTEPERRGIDAGAGGGSHAESVARSWRRHAGGAYPRGMRGGIGLPNGAPGTDGTLLVEWARRAEQGPFTSLGVVDRLRYDAHEPLTTLAAAAAVTERIRLVTMVVIGPLRNPALLAKEAATVQAMSGGRPGPGLGVGARPDDYEAAGIPTAGRGERLAAMIRELRDRWDEPDGPKVDPPPILAGGASDPAVARVALHADGYVHGGGPPRSFARVVERVRAGR